MQRLCLVAPGQRELLLVEPDAESLSDRLERWEPPPLKRWLDDASET